MKDYRADFRKHWLRTMIQDALIEFTMWACNTNNIRTDKDGVHHVTIKDWYDDDDDMQYWHPFDIHG